MYLNVNEHNFMDAFAKLRPNAFTFEGLKALFDYLESLEEDTGEQIELDVIALCCDFNEYDSLEEYLQEYSTDITRNDYDSQEEFEEAVKEEIKERTTFIDIDGKAFIIGVY